MTVVFAIFMGWAVVASLIVLVFHVAANTQRANTQHQLDYFMAVDSMSTHAHKEAMDAYATVVRAVNEENRATLEEIVALVHGPQIDPDVDLDQPDPTLEMNGPYGVNDAELEWRDPTDDALPDEEIMGYGPGRAVMESDITIDR